MKYIKKKIRYPDGSFEDIEIPLSEVDKEISKLIKKNKKMFEILAKL